MVGGCGFAEAAAAGGGGAGRGGGGLLPGSVRPAADGARGGVVAVGGCGACACVGRGGRRSGRGVGRQVGARRRRPRRPPRGRRTLPTPPMRRVGGGGGAGRRGGAGSGPRQRRRARDVHAHAPLRRNPARRLRPSMQHPPPVHQRATGAGVAAAERPRPGDAPVGNAPVAAGTCWLLLLLLLHTAPTTTRSGGGRAQGGAGNASNAERLPTRQGGEAREAAGARWTLGLAHTRTHTSAS